MTHKKYQPAKSRPDSLCQTVFFFSDVHEAQQYFKAEVSGIDIEELQAALGLAREEEVNDLLPANSTRSVRDLLLDDAD